MRHSLKRNTRETAATLVAIWLTACAAQDPDEELRSFVEDATVAVEERDTGFFRGVVAESFIDAQGNDREQVINMIRAFFLLNTEIEAEVDIRYIQDWCKHISLIFKNLYIFDDN